MGGTIKSYANRNSIKLTQGEEIRLGKQASKMYKSKMKGYKKYEINGKKIPVRRYPEKILEKAFSELSTRHATFS